jgi:cysteinyl-tRNA synthetase
MFAFLKPKNTDRPKLRFHNTLTGSLEEFVPLKRGEVKMYNCGPTVYGTQHIGNMSAAVFADVLRRTLEAWDYRVKQVINITDFGHLSSDADEGDDKMTIGLKREGMQLTLENMRTLATKYMEEYFADLDQLGVDRSKITFPRASDYIPQQISLIKALEEKGYAYKTSDGVYFDVSRFKEYGKLGNIDLEGQRAGARVEANPE